MATVLKAEDMHCEKCVERITKGMNASARLAARTKLSPFCIAVYKPVTVQQIIHIAIYGRYFTQYESMPLITGHIFSSFMIFLFPP